MNNQRVKGFNDFAGFGCFIIVFIFGCMVHDGCNHKPKPAPKTETKAKL